MKKNIIVVLIVLCGTICLKAQTSGLIIRDEIKLPKDSTERTLLISSLNNFLNTIGLEDKSTEWILPTEKLHSGFIVGELTQINEKRKSDGELTLQLNNIVPIAKDKYLIQFSYTNKFSLIALFEIMATKENEMFRFSSTLAWNTRNWETFTNDYQTFYYNNGNKSICEQYIKYTNRFDKMLGNPQQKEVVFFSRDSEDLSHLLRLTGILYHIDYNGLTWSMTNNNSEEGGIKLFTSRMSNIEMIDPHDVFHGRCSMGIPYTQQNRRMICGSAYLYTGSWYMSWIDIQKMFKLRMDYDKNTDWLKLYFDSYNFAVSQEKYLLVTQFINALIVQKVEKEQGFAIVKELLASGNMFKERDHFFKVLENVTGINESNFNQKVGKLINEAMKEI